MTRLDIELVNRNIFPTRNKAQMEIKNNNVLVNNKVINKCSYEVTNNSLIEVTNKLKYVSRAGLKLEKAVSEFNIDLTNKVMLDIGSSTGGFTDFAIKNGIKEVIAVDVGTNQMDAELRKNSKVKLYENTDIRNIENNLLKSVNIITIDISFISVTKIIGKINEIKSATEIVCLIKPQFECGKTLADKYKGVILDKTIHLDIIEDIVNEFNKINYSLQDLTYSPVKGGSGNIEYLAYFIKNRKNININYKEEINKSFKELK